MKAKKLWDAYEKLSEKEKAKFKSEYHRNLEEEYLNKLKKGVNAIRELFSFEEEKEECSSVLGNLKKKVTEVVEDIKEKFDGIKDDLNKKKEE